MSGLLEQAGPALLFAQELPTRPVYTLKDLESAGSAKTAHRRIKSLIPLGLATYNRGNFEIKKEVVSQPLDVIKKLGPSLIALKQARRFGRSYNNADINFVTNNMPDSAVVTLDYKAWEITRFQFPNDLYIYLDDVDTGASFLKENGFSEGNSGHVVLLPKIGSFENQIERVYLDCIANGDRSILDAVAIELLHGSEIEVKGRFSVDTIRKVQEDMPRGQLATNCSMF
ncbi:MAG: hypothetical protein ACT4NT_08215 [Nitrososphaerota archaeon]